MAQTHNAPHLVTDSAANGFTPENWLEACAARKFRVDGGRVWHYTSGGMLFPVPMPDLSNPKVREVVAQAYLQFAGARIGQTAEGNVAEAVAKLSTTGETLPRANDNDAYEAVYSLEVAARMAKAGIAAPAKDASAADKAEYREKLKATCEKFHDQLFAKAVAAAKANIVRAPSDKKRQSNKPRVAGVEIDLDDE
jgi:hypothetical protein